jgi:hypothetical protein
MRVQGIGRKDWGTTQAYLMNVYGRREERRERRSEEKAIPYISAVENKINILLEKSGIDAIAEIRLEKSNRITFSFRKNNQEKSLIENPPKEWVEIIDDFFRKYNFVIDSGFSIDEAV